MSDCAHCSADANNYCEWCGVAFCDACAGEHDGCRDPHDYETMD